MAISTNPIRDMLVRRDAEARAIDLDAHFGTGMTYRVESSRGEVVAASVADGKLLLDFAALGHADMRVAATDALGAETTDSFRVRVAGENAYTIAVVPDTQDYTLNAALNPTFDKMTQWLADNKESHNIQFVTHVGDVTYNNLTREWDVAKDALSKLDGVIPYALGPGNHDLAPGGSAADRSQDRLSQYFSPADAAARDGSFGGVYDREPASYQNNYHSFTAPDGTQWLVLTLEFGPRDDVLRWGGEVIEAHLDHRVIITTHGYMAVDGRTGPLTERLTGENGGTSYGVGNDIRGAADGDRIWTELAGKYPNVAFTFSGHNFGDGAQTQVSIGAGGQPVHQMFVNYQNGIAREVTGNGDAALGRAGGNGAIRLVVVDPENDTVSTETYFVGLDDYLDGFRGKEIFDRDGLTGPYIGHQEEFAGVDLSAPAGFSLARAGADLFVTTTGEAATVVLDGSASRLVAGGAHSILWRDAAGEILATGLTPELRLAGGQHKLTLEITNQAGLTTRDAVAVTVSTPSTLLAENFNDGELTGWAVPPGDGGLRFGTAAELGVAPLPGGEAGLLAFPKFAANQWLQLDPEAAAQTPAGTITAYSLVMDLLVRDGEPWTSLFQTATGNSGDAEIYLRNNNDGTAGIGISGNYQGSLTYGAWHRVGLTFEPQGGGVLLKKFIDGVKVGEQVLADAARFAVDADKGLLLFAEPNLATSGGFVGHVVFAAGALPETTLAGFGAARAGGILDAAALPAGATQFGFDGGRPVAEIGGGALQAVEPAQAPLMKVVGTVHSGAAGEAGLEGRLLDRSNAEDNILVWQGEGSAGWTDYVVDATLRSLDTDAFGVVFRWQDPDNHYRLTLDTAGDARSLVKVQGGVETVLAEVPQGYRLDADMALRVVVTGNEIRVQLDGRDVFGGPVVDADPLAAGTVGLLSDRQKGASFDDIRVTQAVLTAEAGADLRLVDLDGDGRVQVPLDAGGSFGGAAGFSWSLDGQALAAGLTAEASLAAGRHAVTLTATGAGGAVATDQVMVEVVGRERVLAHDDFSAGMARWTVVDEGDLGGASAWSVAGGRLRQDGDIHSRQLTSNGNASNADQWNAGWSPLGDVVFGLRKGTYALYDEAAAQDWQDYSVEATLRTEDTQGIGLLFHYKDAGNYLKLEMDRDTGLVQVLRMQDGREDLVARTLNLYEVGADMRLRLDVQDGRVQAWLDGEAVFAAPAETGLPPGGTIGLYSWGSEGVAFDDVTVIRLEPVPEAATPVAATAAGGLLAGTAGNDHFLGGAGQDLVRYDGLRTEHDISFGPVVLQVAGPEGQDLLQDIETVRFLDGRVELSGDSGAHLIDRLYQGALGRQADAAGLAFWDDVLADGGSLATLASGLLNSAEGAARAAADDGAFVQGLYRSLLGREASAAEAGFWTDGFARADVLRGIAVSREAVAFGGEAPLTIADHDMLQVARAYQVLLGRDVDQAGLAFWDAQVDAVGEAGLLAGIAASGEFATRAAAPGLDDAVFVARLYDDAFDRTAAAEETGYWLQRLASGEDDRREVAIAFAEAPEGQLALQQLATDGFLFA
jgi:3',5'-cyclic AMP phosphodiesterase CpdA